MIVSQHGMEDLEHASMRVLITFYPCISLDFNSLNNIENVLLIFEFLMSTIVPGP